MTMFWRCARVYCGVCKRKCEKVSGYLKGDTSFYRFDCHGESLEIKSSDQERFRVNGPVPDTYMVFPGGRKRVTKAFRY